MDMACLMILGCPRLSGNKVASSSCSASRASWSFKHHAGPALMPSCPLETEAFRVGMLVTNGGITLWTRKGSTEGRISLGSQRGSKHSADLEGALVCGTLLQPTPAYFVTASVLGAKDQYTTKKQGVRRTEVVDL